ncbi:phosphoglycerate kinase [Klebsormidium nitens]|uniref:Phosphoglycerate kinase n=1 Tax=Klebsormidium nitens TaxID=105231 RepID=A0A1Y1I4I4_KLENI|nr:phosphoglycerate kinase [Klebsormidium nitens]|eukprot:GAQ84339.1 phosphoglycerate kinase [Klebsormidium nitens]
MGDSKYEYKVDPRLPLVQDADLQDKIVLLRVDHNVVKKGKILDQYRIDCTLATLYNIAERGGRPILMTHVNRPYDKKTKTLKCDPNDAVDAVVTYLQRKLRIKFAVPNFQPRGDKGILDIDTSINHLIHDLRERRIGGIYLPNTRWFAGEEDKGEQMQRFVVQLAGLADCYVNDAFGSWQPHATTFHITKLLPSYAGLLMQSELEHVSEILRPSRPFVSIVAGSKYDTKIGPLSKIYETVDHLLLGGVVYNAYLCAKYGVKIKGVDDSDVELAKGLVKQDEQAKKLVELPYLVESDTLDGRKEGQYRTISTADFKPGHSYGYILDTDPKSFEVPEVARALSEAKTIFVNAVMGFTPFFFEGTKKMDEVIDSNTGAQKYYGGGDTLQELKSLNPGLYHAAIDNSKYYLFTGGGTVLTVIEKNDPYGLEPVKALMDNAVAFGTPTRASLRSGEANGHNLPNLKVPPTSTYYASLFESPRVSKTPPSSGANGPVFTRMDSGIKSYDTAAF